MRAYNYVIDITPDIKVHQFRLCAIDFNQQCYENSVFTIGSGEKVETKFGIMDKRAQLDYQVNSKNSSLTPESSFLLYVINKSEDRNA